MRSICSFRACRSRSSSLTSLSSSWYSPSTRPCSCSSTAYFLVWRCLCHSRSYMIIRQLLTQSGFICEAKYINYVPGRIHYHPQRRLILGLKVQCSSTATRLTPCGSCSYTGTLLPFFFTIAAEWVFIWGLKEVWDLTFSCFFCLIYDTFSSFIDSHICWSE